MYRRALCTDSITCSNRLVDVQRPDWWSYPIQCSRGHPWEPGQVIVSWEPCDCPAAKGNHYGHRRVSCQATDCRSVWRVPPHERSEEELA